MKTKMKFRLFFTSSTVNYLFIMSLQAKSRDSETKKYLNLWLYLEKLELSILSAVQGSLRCQEAMDF